MSRIGWALSKGQSLSRESLLGGAIGVTLAALYLGVLSPLISLAQLHLGDYVAPGEILPTLGGMLGYFFIANVILAPFVEESLYRGYAIGALRQRHSALTATAVSCLFFGLLHWAGGLWYMLATALIAGSVFSLLYLWRGNIIAAISAHLTLNGVEFIYLLVK